jgi:hypothetical protein
VFLGFWLGYLGILSCVLGGALCFFDIYNITYQKIYIFLKFCAYQKYSRSYVFFIWNSLCKRITLGSNLCVTVTLIL